MFWQACMNSNSSSRIKQMPTFSLSHTILLRCANNGFLVYNTIGRKEIKAIGVEKFSTIVTSDHGDFVLELCMNHEAKMFNGRPN